jgi:ribosomal protein S18 acetylase RimI-like enzyme
MIRAFSDNDVDTAVEMLAGRHERHRAAQPLLPADVDFRRQIESEWSVEGAGGVISEAGYLFARPLPYMQGGLTWMVAGIGGHAVAGDPEHARDLYAAAAADWTDAGHVRHAVFVPSSDDALVDAWFRLSFGASGVLAARETAPAQPSGDGFDIRPGSPQDIEAAAQLDREMHVSMVPSPSFSEDQSWTHEQYVDDWRGTWDEEQFVHFVAERDGSLVAHILLYNRPHDLRVPKDSIDLAHASTFPEARGSGAGRALTEHVLLWAFEHGYSTMTTDWRMTNLLASRFWPKRGFERTFLRLYRALP